MLFYLYLFIYYLCILFFRYFSDWETIKLWKTIKSAMICFYATTISLEYLVFCFLLVNQKMTIVIDMLSLRQFIAPLLRYLIWYSFWFIDFSAKPTTKLRIEQTKRFSFYLIVHIKNKLQPCGCLLLCIFNIIYVVSNTKNSFAQFEKQIYGRRQKTRYFRISLLYIFGKCIGQEPGQTWKWFMINW